MKLQTVPTYPDEVLEHLADRYLALQMPAYGVTLLQFLADPARYEALAKDFLPLLPAQQAAVRVHWQQATGAKLEVVPAEEVLPPFLVEQQVEHLPRRNGVIFEVLRHCAWPRRRPTLREVS